jgi:DNA-binding CsgD family transcriptional regulator
MSFLFLILSVIGLDLLDEYINKPYFHRNNIGKIILLIKQNIILTDKGTELCKLLYNKQSITYREASNILKISIENVKKLYQHLMIFFNANGPASLIFILCSKVPTLPRSELLSDVEHDYLVSVIMANVTISSPTRRTRIERRIKNKLGTDHLSKAIFIILKNAHKLKELAEVVFLPEAFSCHSLSEETVKKLLNRNM